MQPSIDDYAELVKLKVIFRQRIAHIKSSFELLSQVYDWLKRENRLHVQLQAESAALRAELQLPDIEFAPINDLQANEISDMLKAIRVMLRGPPHAGTSRVDGELVGPSQRYVSPDDEGCATDLHTASSTEKQIRQAFSLPGGPEDTHQITRRHASSSSGHQDSWHQEAEGMHVKQCYHATGLAQADCRQTVLAQTVQPQLRRADVPRVLEPGTTTLMIRNVPARYDQPQLLQEWPPNGAYDFLYLPCTKKGYSRGYAFLNFVTPEHAVQFQQQWHGGHLSNHGTTKHLDVSAARAQGVAANLEDILSGADWNTWIQHASVVPLIFNGTQMVDVESVVLRLGLNTQL